MRKDPILSGGIFVLALGGFLNLTIGGYHANVNHPAHNFHQELLGAAMFAAALFIQAIRRN
jgi:hypothetical protein